jgi:transposase-like protein
MSNLEISDECPYCKRPCKIVAVDLSLLRGNAALFVCPDCGMTRSEIHDEARRKLRGRRRISVRWRAALPPTWHRLAELGLKAKK